VIDKNYLGHKFYSDGEAGFYRCSSCGIKIDYLDGNKTPLPYLVCTEYDHRDKLELTCEEYIIKHIIE
jgi:hypothetical protein